MTNKHKDSALCKNCQHDVPIEMDLDLLDKKEDCPSIHVDAECPKCKKKYVATCYFDFVRGSWREDGIILKGSEK